MYRVGYIDDDTKLYHDYAEILEAEDIELLFPHDCKTKEEVLKWVIKAKIKCFMVDYKLAKMFDFSGTDLVFYINSKIPDLPCIILTIYPTESLEKNLVVSNLIEHREILIDFDNTEREEFINKIKHSVKVFETRMSNHSQEYERLFIQKTNHNLNALDEERFLELYKLLRIYGEVDDLPSELLKSETSIKMDELLSGVKKLIEKVEKV